MRKKILVFLSVVSICLFGLFNSLVVSAQDGIEFPDNLKALQFRAVLTNQTHEKSYEYLFEYVLPYQVEGNIEDFDYFLVHKHSFTYGFLKGEIDIEKNSYKLEEIRLVSGETRFRFRLTVEKTMANTLYPVRLMPFFTDDSKMYLNFEYKVDKIMKNFLRAEPNFDNGSLVGNWGEEKYYMYLDAYVYLPDGTKRSITIMPDLIEDYFENYDFVVVAFNLSPRARFWSPDIYPNSSISGLSYIVYDLRANTTTFYDYQGNSVVQLNRISYIDNPQFFIPETEALDYQLKASYEEGKTEGYKQGREEGIRAGRRETQEEMQKVIDDLIEYYEREVEKAYNRGKLEGVDEQFDIFGYLEALFGEQGLGRLLRLELLPGVSLGAVIMIPLAFWLVSFIMRWFR